MHIEQFTITKKISQFMIPEKIKSHLPMFSFLRSIDANKKEPQTEGNFSGHVVSVGTLIHREDDDDLFPKGQTGSGPPRHAAVR